MIYELRFYAKIFKTIEMMSSCSSFLLPTKRLSMLESGFDKIHSHFNFLNEIQLDNFNEDELHSIGFKKKTWKAEGETFIEYSKRNKNTELKIYNTMLVKIRLGDSFHEIPNCNNISDVKQLIHIFNI